MKRKQISTGDRFFDEHNCRYVTVDGQGCDPHCFSCEVEELNEAGDFEKLEHDQLFMDTELWHMQEVKSW